MPRSPPKTHTAVDHSFHSLFLHAGVTSQVETLSATEIPSGRRTAYVILGSAVVLGVGVIALSKAKTLRAPPPPPPPPESGGTGWLIAQYIFTSAAVITGATLCGFPPFIVIGAPLLGAGVSGFADALNRS